MSQRMNLPAPTTEKLKPLPPGSYPAMLTAFHDDGSFDWRGIDLLIEDCLEHGAAGIFACGLSAEIMNMDDDEQGRLAEYIVKRVDGRIPVVAAAITSGSIEDQAALIRRVHDCGADAVAIGVCQWATREEDDQTWNDHVAALLEQIPDEVRLAMYETPLPYHRLLTEKNLHWAAGTGRFFFLKDTSCCLDTIRARVKILAGSNLRLLNANTRTLLESLNAEVYGFCGIGSNYMPRLYAWLCENWSTQPQLAAEMQGFLAGSEALMEGSTYPASAKHYLKLRGLDIGASSRKIPGGISDECAAQLAELRKQECEWLERIDN